MKYRELKQLPFLFQILILLGMILPRWLGLLMASIIGTVMGSLKLLPQNRAIRANQWVIHDQQLSKKELRQYPRIVFRSVSKCFFDYFYFLTRPEKLEEIVHFSPEAQAVIKRIENNEPCVIVCPHLSNFDLMGYALAIHNVRIQVLSFPDPVATYRWQNQLRHREGIVVTPMSLSAFRQARQRLREGGSVLTGLDRPLEKAAHEKYQPQFFGYPTHLPVAYARMALEANVPVFVFAAAYLPNGKYYLEGSAPIWMEPHDDLETEILANVHKVLDVAEVLIRKYPQQWAMFYPVWPQFLGI
ncbi:MAG: lysophospholipid acyltransferase family protein [Chloroflexi bacterium]|jgi:KDO2-lipid IV(A) lauroyltransferase|nr:lysophospholipid acyltransferase family protein [Chloroflexota bacterium]